jgi:protein-L-isoaspartate(D-aspartate) O-methyltransferase
MVATHLKGRDIHDEAVLSAMLKVPRHRFVGPEYQDLAYSDGALPISENQTISQPYIVALMTQSAQLKSTDRVLEIGTGSGEKVFTIEIIGPLAHQARNRMEALEYNNVVVRHGDGYQGWNEEAPFDAILITAAAPEIPQPLVDQLKVGGRMVMPLGDGPFSQDLIAVVKTETGVKREFITGVLFVPMTGEVRE